MPSHVMVWHVIASHSRFDRNAMPDQPSRNPYTVLLLTTMSRPSFLPNLSEEDIKQAAQVGLWYRFDITPLLTLALS